MKNNNTLFWVLAVICVYVLLIFPKVVKNGTSSGGSFGGGGTASRGNKNETEKEEKPDPETLEKYRNGGLGYTV